MYAKRCMAILTACTPYKSNIVISDGEFWVVDWVTGYKDKLQNVVTEADINEDASSDFKYKEENYIDPPPGYRELQDEKA